MGMRMREDMRLRLAAWTVIVTALGLFARLPATLSAATFLDLVVAECEDPEKFSTLLCLTTLGDSGVISIFRKGITRIQHNGILVKLQPSATGDAEVTLIGGNSPEFRWISFSVANVARGSMARGGPALVCMNHRTDVFHRVYFLGSPEGSLQLTPLGPTLEKVGSKTESDFFKETFLLVETASGSRSMICTFTIPRTTWMLDGTEMDLANTPYNIVFGQGKILDRLHMLGDPTSLEPATHTPTSRYVSTAKYLIHRASDAQTHIAEYLQCGITEYCLGAGFDGCGSTSFDCKFFAKFTRKSDTTLGVFLRGTTFKGFVGLGFSSSGNILPSFGLKRWNNLAFIVVCEPGNSPAVLRVTCDQKNVTDEAECASSTENAGQPVVTSASPATKSTIVNSNDATVDTITCEFDLVFTGDDLDMMKQKGTRLFLGGDQSGSTEWLKLLRIFPENDQNVYFSITENAALLEEGQTALPAKDAWALIRQERLHLQDPADLDPVQNAGSALKALKSIAARSILLLLSITQFFTIIILHS